MKVYEDGYGILLAYQDAWNSETAEIAVIEKARRIGLSWGDEADRVIRAAAGGIRVRGLPGGTGAGRAPGGSGLRGGDA